MRRAGLAALLTLSACASIEPSTPALEARWTLAGEPLLVRSLPGFAGAVSSIRFRGVEYLDASDHGRLLQGAVSFDGQGECDNPTLAGASSDPRGRSASRLLAAFAGPERWSTVSRMAYWLRPGQLCTGSDGRPRPAANRTRLSDVTYAQTFTPGWGRPNAVHAAVTITPERPRAQAVVEVVTAYVPPRFSVGYVFDPASGRLTPDNAASRLEEQPRPVALATVDGRHAIALVSLEGEAPARYSRMLRPEVGKINIVHRPAGTYAAGPHRYRYAWLVGTTAEVEAALQTLTKQPA